jgi:hypothetical protein
MLFNKRRRKVLRTCLKARVGDARSPSSLQPSTKFVRTYNAKAHEITDAITAVIINADAGLHLLRTQSPDLEEVRQVLNSIANDSKRAGDIVVRTRVLMKKVIAPSQRNQGESRGEKGRFRRVQITERSASPAVRLRDPV